jgi:hypothetical protein
MRRMGDRVISEFQTAFVTGKLWRHIYMLVNFGVTISLFHTIDLDTKAVAKSTRFQGSPVDDAMLNCNIVQNKWTLTRVNDSILRS